MGLEEREATVILKQNAASTPDIAWLRPAQLKDHFWGTVVPGSHDSGVVLMIKGGTSEVCHADARVPDGFLLTALFLVVQSIEVRVDKQDVFWLEVSVSQLVVM